VAGHGREPGVDLPGLARTDPVNSGLHIIEDPALRHTAEHPEGLGQRIEQHLVGLQKISPNRKCTAVRQLGVCHLQLGLLAGNDRIRFSMIPRIICAASFLAPVELERFAWLEHQRHESAATTGLCIALPIRLPTADKGRDAVVGAIEAKAYKIGVHLLGRVCASLHAPGMGRCSICLRDLVASIRSQPVSFSAKGSSLLGRSGTLNFGSTAPLRRYLRIVFLDKPVRRSISRMGIPSRKCQRLITLNNAMSITPCCLQTISQRRFKHGSVLDGNL
jgi:hypothetical protein